MLNLNLLTSFTLQLHLVTPCIWLGTTHPCNPPNYGPWVNLHFFIMCTYKHCFLPMLLVLAMKCCTKMRCPLHHNHHCCLLPSPICLPHLLICTDEAHLFTHCLSTIICVMLMSIFFFCYIIYYISSWFHFWPVCAHIFSFCAFVLIICFVFFVFISVPYILMRAARLMTSFGLSKLNSESELFFLVHNIHKNIKQEKTQ